MTGSYLVLGPESSGTRLMTRLLMAAGCRGDDGHGQHFDDELPSADGTPIVWRRSVPHAEQWPDIQTMVAQLTDTGYSTQAVVMTRAWWAMMPSQVANRNVPDQLAALGRIRRAYAHIYGPLWDCGVPFTVVSYEALVQWPGETVGNLCDLLGLPMPALDVVETIKDANSKWANSVVTN